MKTLHYFISVCTIIGLFLLSCEKDDNGEPQYPSEQDIVGDWELVDGTYIGNLSFQSDNKGLEAFVDENESGVGYYTWTLDENTLTITYVHISEGFESYNDVVAETSITCTISIADNQLVINYDGADYIYEKVLTDHSVIHGSWEFTDGDYHGYMSFDTTSFLCYDLFIDNTTMGAAEYSFGLFGNLLVMTPFEMIGNYESYNEISPETALVSTISVAGNQLTITNNNTPYIYSKTAYIDNKNLSGAWKYTEDSYNGVLTFYEDTTLSLNDGGDSFIDNTESGYSTFKWILSGNKLLLEYRRMLGDYESYNGISTFDLFLVDVSASTNELTFTSDEVDYVYTRMSDEEIVIGEQIDGSWVMIDDDLKDTITYNYNPNPDEVIYYGIDAFATSTQSGSADFQWNLNGNMLITHYYMSTFTGDYESYMGVSEGDVFVYPVSISGNQMTATYDGTDFVYTKQE